MTANTDGESMAERYGDRAGDVTPYERDIAEQARALGAFIAAPRPAAVALKPLLAYPRVVVTGMGSSHFAGARTWRRLVAAGSPAWWIDTAALLESPGLITPETLLVITSQSGASGETVALLDELESAGSRPEVIGIANDESSPLARRATHLIRLHSGAEATVSTKSYVNSLAAHEYLTCVLLGGDSRAFSRELRDGVDALEPQSAIDTLTVAAAAAPDARIALIGGGDQVATALFGGLILKEAAKVSAEGFLAGNFRHGPLEIAGPGFAAFVLGVSAGDEGEPLRRLAGDIAATGATVFTFGAATVPGCEPLLAMAYDGFAGLVAGAELCHRVSVQVARARGLVPGEFRFGQKVTGL
jgi:glucosamine--fructose-6-phosphate aminotransferase (isomerizing)